MKVFSPFFFFPSFLLFPRAQDHIQKHVAVLVTQVSSGTSVSHNPSGSRKNDAGCRAAHEAEEEGAHPEPHVP